MLLLFSCNKEDDPVVAESADRTVLAYFLTKDLSSALQDNIEMLFEGLQNTKKASIVLIYWDNKVNKFDSPCILKYSSDGQGRVNGVSKEEFLAQTSSDRVAFAVNKAQVVKTYSSQTDATNPSVMTSILKDMISLAPNKSYGLIFGSHGTSWLPKNYSRTRSLAATYDTPIEVTDLNDALLNTGTKFEYIITDACMMGSMEVVYEIRNTCNYYICSSMEVPMEGFPYHIITPYLFSNDLEDYTDKICSTYASYYTEKKYWGNSIVIDCSQVAALTRYIANYISNYQPIDLSSVQEYGAYSFKYLSYDIKDFFNTYTGNNLPAEFTSQIDRTIISRGFVSTAYGAYPSFKNTTLLCGLGMYIPQPSYTNWNSYLSTLSWASASGWKTYLDKIK